ncbi:hypothetical protein ACHQM5_025560 [Ranunculus cassubicifolius]
MHSSLTVRAFPPYINSDKPQSLNRSISPLHSRKELTKIIQIHAQLIKNGNQQNPFSLFEFLRLCSNYHYTDYARQVFEKIENPNVYLYTALIDGLISSGSYLDGIQAYVRMIKGSVKPDPYVVTSVLKACGSQLALEEGKQVHNHIVKLQFSSNRSIRMILAELYGKCGEFADARKLFEEMPKGDVAASTVMICFFHYHGMVDEAFNVFNETPSKDTVCWTAMIDGLVQNEEMNKALELFRIMQTEDVRPNEVTVVCVLSACAHLGALELGRWVHSYVGKYKIKLNSYVGNALICMYSKCGSLEEAEEIFKEMRDKDIITYNSMLAGLSMHGKSNETIKMFEELLERGFMPSNISFVSVLNACSHGGLVDMGLKIFQSMTENYSIEPQIEHYGCIVDLLGRVGRVEEAYNFIARMRVKPDHIIWGSLLSACKIHGNLKLGEKVAKILIDGGVADSGTYILLSNIYAFMGKWEATVSLREEMKERGVLKEPGCSSIELKNDIHEFFAGDVRHHEREKIYKELQELNLLLGSERYTPDTQFVLHDIEEAEKQKAVAVHSERLAICYGLISTKPGTTLRVVKNLRICNDCHSVIKIVAKIKRRKIIVRDRNRFHHFESGSCSCGDYW